MRGLLPKATNFPQRSYDNIPNAFLVFPIQRGEQPLLQKTYSALTRDFEPSFAARNLVMQVDLPFEELHINSIGKKFVECENKRIKICFGRAQKPSNTDWNIFLVKFPK